MELNASFHFKCCLQGTTGCRKTEYTATEFELRNSDVTGIISFVSVKKRTLWNFQNWLKLYRGTFKGNSNVESIVYKVTQ